ncbi:calcium-binding protein (plasmid) [Rhizobium leguminosarum]
MAALELGADLEAVFDSPFLLLTSFAYDADKDQFQNQIGNISGYVMALAPSDDRAKFEYYAKAVTGLQGLRYEYFDNDKTAFKAFILSKVTSAEPDSLGLLAFVDAYIDAGKLTGGTAEADAIAGTSGADVILAGRGNDVINGGGDDDSYFYSRGDGTDTITEGANGGSADKLVFTDINPGSVTLVRNGIDVTLVIAESAPGAGDAGSVLLKETLDDYYGRGIDSIVFADGTTWDRNYLRTTLLAQASTAGNDTITGFNVADVINAGAGNDTINADSGKDLITGGRGNDVINGGGDDDSYFYSRGDGTDTITEGANGGSADKLVFTDINPGSVTLVRNGIDVTLVIAESAPGAGDGGSVLLKETLDDYYGRGIDSIVFADGTTWDRNYLRTTLLAQASTAGNDTITGFNVADVINAGAGNDTINADSGKDLITGGRGNDVINGGGDDDSYFYSRGDGTDTITEGANGGSADKLVFTDINPGSVTLVRNGIDVTLVIAESAPGAGDAGSVLLKETLDDYYGRGIDSIVFADGTTWDRNYLRTTLLAQVSTAGNDTITGFNVADVINAGAGNDTINADSGKDLITGGRGNDVINGGGDDDSYFYSRGDGTDTITEGANGGSADKLVFTDINPGSVTLVRNGIDVTLVIAESAPGAGDGGSVLLKETLDDYYGRGIDSIVFADGTTWDRNYLRSVLVNYAGTSGNDTITGSNVADVINAGAGNDTINADSGKDLITGGRGNDVINGGGDDDSYFYSRGDGTDTITEGANGGSADKLVFTDINPGSVTLVRNGIDVTLVIAESAPGAGDGGSVLLKETLDDYYGRGIDSIVFADGTTWDRNYLRTTLLAQVSTAGNDTITGFNVADVINAGAGNDTINADSGKDLITGGRGNDVINGGGDDDSYFYSRGDGTDTITEGANGGSADKLVFTDINPGSVTLVRNGIDVTLVIAESAPGAGDAGSVLLKETLDDYYGRGIDSIVFADGTTWDRNYLRTTLLAQASTAGNDTITGFNVADVINAGAGNDTINADSGKDLITGGRGNDVINGGGDDDSYFYSRGDGTDTITEGANGGSADKLVFTDINPGSVTLVRNGIDVTLVIAESAPGAGDGGSVLLKETLDDYYGRGIDSIVFADGTTWDRNYLRTTLLAQASTAGNDTITGFNVADVINAGAGNDTINADSGKDLITGGRGNDVINGGGDDDSYFYSRGDGTDTITEGANGGSADKLVFTDINPGSVTLVRNGIDVTLVIAESAPGAGDGGSVLLKETLDDYYGRGIDSIVFADGTTWDRNYLRTTLLAQASTAGNDTITGFNVADVINAGAGNDTINADSGKDLITGGRGNDVINGGGDDDSYFYSRGDGTDTITEGANGGSADKLVFTDINPGSVTLVRNGIDVTLVIAESAPGAGDAGSVLLKETLDDYYGRGIDSIVFADGTTWTRSDMLTHIAYIGGTVGNDTISGTSGADDVRAGRGNDTLAGGAGNDTYVYLNGDGNDIIDEQTSGTDSDILKLNDYLRSEIRFERISSAVNDVAIRVLATGETITLKNQFNLAGGVESIIFKDGEVLGGASGILDTALKGLVAIYGTSGNDVLGGTPDGDTFIGGTGDDRFNSGAGSDVYVYAKGNGNDYIDDESGSTIDVDVLRLTDLNASDVMLSRVGAHSVLTVIETGHTITFDEQFYSTTANWGLDRIQFADGTVWDRAQIQAASWIRGTAGNDTLTGTTGNDTFTGGNGDDRFNSGAGSDTYLYAKGNGNDYIDEESGSTTDVDILRLTDLNASDVMLSRVGAHSVLTVIETGHTITLDEQFYSTTANWGMDRIEFADGTAWDRAQIQAASWIRGAASNDTLTGTSGNDTLTGGAGSDVLNGGAGNDTIYGDAGNDNLTGGTGDDLFVFKADFGNDIVTDFTIGAGSVDVLDIGTDVFADFASVLAAASQVGADTVITHDANTSITLKNVALTSLHQDDFRFTAAA